MAKPRSTEKRERIFQAGLRLFSHNGYTKTTIKDIANEAGVSFGTVFTYFQNKEELFNSCVTEPLEEFRDHILTTHETLDSMTYEMFVQLVGRHVDFFLEKEHYLRVVQYVIGQPERFPEMEVLDQFADDFMDFIQSVAKVGMKKGFLPEGNPEEIGYGYLAFLMGARLTFTDHANVQLTNAFKNQALRLFGAGITEG
ncbi:TetR/AcrR family transcriptional regulator [Virgibacillus kekensis]|uniref:TetR/AcrR family transcriptional regulator n=1 Tax=Virgibacillus kekensis TaxID=202261 RepID=A0ABV9DJL2_9BACI